MRLSCQVKHSALRAVFICALPLLAASLPVLTGCSSRLGAKEIQSGMLAGNIEGLADSMKDGARDGSLESALNAARLYQLVGKWPESMTYYSVALGVLEEYESRAVVNVRGVGAGLGAFTLARGLAGYYGSGHERSMLHTLNGLNYLLLGDVQGAAVEMRRMERRQELWLAEKTAKVETALAAGRSPYAAPADLPAGYPLRGILLADGVRENLSGYQDAFSYALSSAVCRAAGDYAYAGVSARRAVALNPALRELFAAHPGYARAEGEEDVRALPLPSLKGPAAVAGTGMEAGAAKEVTVVAFSGLAPALEIQRVRLPAPVVGYLMLDLPVLKPYPRLETSPRATLDGVNLPLALALNSELAAYQDLWDDLRYELGAAFSRAAVRGAAAYGSGVAVAAALDEERPLDSGTTRVVALAVTLLTDLFTGGIDSGARNWALLPGNGYLGFAGASPGAVLTVSFGDSAREIVVKEDIRGIFVVLSQSAAGKARIDYAEY